jgi:tryptophanyl-tRNA synthetase
MDLLALGLNPEQATLFIQSDVPEISELNWILLSGTPMGLLERCVSYKDKIAKGLPVVSGLFAYPVLQAADILAYDSTTVPVGEDQIQHVEVCRDIAQAFNHTYGEVFVLPKAKVLDSSAKVPGTDGEKMSKSYGNFIEIFEPVKPCEKRSCGSRRTAARWKIPRNLKRIICFSCSNCLVRMSKSQKWQPCIEPVASATAM